jgi:hypothetical protein
MDAPEGNLVIVERGGHESQRRFPYWEYGWVGKAHRLASTAYVTQLTPGIFRFLRKHTTTVRLVS